MVSFSGVVARSAVSVTQLLSPLFCTIMCTPVSVSLQIPKPSAKLSACEAVHANPKLKTSFFTPFVLLSLPSLSFLYNFLHYSTRFLSRMLYNLFLNFFCRKVETSNLYSEKKIQNNLSNYIL